MPTDHAEEQRPDAADEALLNATGPGFLDGILAWSLRNRLLVVVLTILVAGLGIRSLRRLPIDAVPDVTNVQVQILTDVGVRRTQVSARSIRHASGQMAVWNTEL